MTPDDLVRLGLERQLLNDAVARRKKAKRLETAILPVFMGKNGKVRQLGQGETNALILPNRYYQEGEPMSPQPVGKGGLMAVDNKSYFAPIVVTPEVEPPPTEGGIIVYLSIGAELFMFTGVSSTLENPDQTTFIPYAFAPNPSNPFEGEFILDLDAYQQELIDNPPTGQTFGAFVEIEPENFVSVDFGESFINQNAEYPDPQQIFTLSNTCKSNFLVNYEVYLYQGVTGGNSQPYTDNVDVELWLLNPTTSEFELFSTNNIPLALGGQTATNLLPSSFSDGANNGLILECSDPSSNGQTFFVRYKNPSKTNWFEL